MDTDFFSFLRQGCFLFGFFLLSILVWTDGCSTNGAYGDTADELLDTLLFPRQ